LVRGQSVGPPHKESGKEKEKENMGQMRGEKGRRCVGRDKASNIKKLREGGTIQSRSKKKDPKKKFPYMKMGARRRAAKARRNQKKKMVPRNGGLPTKKKKKKKKVREVSKLWELKGEEGRSRMRGNKTN